MKLLKDSPEGVWNPAGANYVFPWKISQLHPAEIEFRRTVK